MDDWLSIGLPLTSFARDAKSLDADAFARLHGRAFLQRVGSSAAGPRVPTQTRVPGSTSEPGEATGDVTILVHPLRRRPVSEHPFIGIGRLDGNDVALVDDTVSKFHAFVKEMPEGFALQDARSRNGTMVDGVPVAARGAGAPTILRVGVTVVFGSVTTTFIDAARLIDFARLTTWRT